MYEFARVVRMLLPEARVPLLLPQMTSVVDCRAAVADTVVTDHRVATRCVTRVVNA
jgi:hypothetical protein